MKKYNKGYLLVETIVSLTVFTFLLGGFALLLGQLKSYGQYNLVRQQCIQAASAELDSISATGEGLDGKVLSSIWDGIETEITVSGGVGDFDGLMLVEVRAVGEMPKKEIAITLSRYVEHVDN